MFVFAASAQAIDVSSASYFKGLYSAGGTQDIKITAANQIIFNDWLGISGTGLNMTVDLNGKELAFRDSSYSGNAGVMYLNGANTSFTNGSVTFANNSASSSGGAILNSNGKLNISDSLVEVNGNSARSNGGAIYNYSNAAINISGSSVSFQSNISGYLGGAIYNYSGSTITISSSSVNFSGNSASSSGGAIYNAAGATLIFTSSTLNFTGNTAPSNGGAIYNLGRVIFNVLEGNNITFSQNEAPLGKDIYQTVNAMTTISGGGSVVINGGIAGAGLITKDGKGTLEINADSSRYVGIFTQNGGKTIVSSASFGGTHNINSGEIEFADGAAFTSGAAFAINNATMTISASSANGDLVFNNQLSGNGIIDKTGGALLRLEGDITFDGTFKASNGTLALASGASYTGDELNIDGAALDMQNDTFEKITVNNFTSKTNTKLDIHYNGDSDQIIAAYSEIGGNIDIRAGVGTYGSVSYNLIISTKEALNGVFISSSISDSALKYELRYDNNIVRLVINGISASDFKSLKGLSYNQTNTAEIFDKISLDPPMGWEAVLSDMNNKQKDGDIEQVKNFLSQTSGYFLANVIRNAAADSPNNEVYDKIRKRSEGSLPGNGMWAQVKGGVETFREDENSIDEYQDASIGLMLGLDKYIEKKSIMWGIYARFNKDNIKQKENSADGNKNGLGIYGGYIRDKYEIKAMLLGSYDIFNTERKVMGQTAKADINAFTINADIEGSLKYKISERLKFKPYTGIELQDANYGSFKENGAGIYNLDVESGNYIRSAARIGTAIEYEKERVSAYAKAEGKYLLSEAMLEIKNRFRDIPAIFSSRGSQEGKIEIGIGAGGEVRVSKSLIAYANVNYYGAQRYSNIYGNVGIRYMFGATASKENIEGKKSAEAEEKRIIYKTQTEASQERRHKPIIKPYRANIANFASNKFNLSKEGKEAIKKRTNEIKKYDYRKITVEGHADIIGTDKINDELSRKRAISVYKEFLLNGISAEKINYIGFGSRMPIESNKTKAGRAANRRVGIIVE
jgi:predicted outer membrane repeat protein